MRFRLLSLVALIAAAPVLLAQTSQVTQATQTPVWQPPATLTTLYLWPNGAPGEPTHPAPETNAAISHLVAGKHYIRLTNVSDPTLTLYPAEGNNTGAAVLDFPGGSYKILALNIEGTEICHWLNSIGVNCILVKYRVPDSGPYPQYSAALQDAQRAMGLVREHAAEWHIDPQRIGVIGFSAGGNLAAQLSTHFDHRVYAPIDAADKLSCRPDFAMLIYPAYIAEANDLNQARPAFQVTANTPPAFLVQAEDDPVHVENAIDYFLLLKNAGVPAQLHLYAHGGHGYGLRPITQSVSVNDVPDTNTTPLPISHWPQLAAAWMRTIGVLK